MELFEALAQNPDLILVDGDPDHLLVFIIAADKDVILLLVRVEDAGILRDVVGDAGAFALLQRGLENVLNKCWILPSIKQPALTMYLVNSLRVSFLAVSVLRLHCLLYLQLSDMVRNTRVLGAAGGDTAAICFMSSLSDMLRSSSTEILVMVLLTLALCLDSGRQAENREWNFTIITSKFPSEHIA